MNPHRMRLLSRALIFSGLLAACGSLPAAATAPPVVADAQVALASGFGNPQGIAISSHGVVYVADTANNRVVTVSSTGVMTPVNITGYTLSGPGAVAVDLAGNLYIADTNNARVLEVPGSGAPVLIAGAPTLSLPISVAVDVAGDVYIGDANNAAVYEVPSGGALKQLTIQNAGNLFPQVLVTDTSSNLYIADLTSNDILELPAGATIANNVTPSGITLNSPAGLAFDAGGDLFVLDSGNSRVIEVPQADSSHPYQVPITGLNVASSLALDPGGNVYVTDYANNNVTELVYAGNAVSLGSVAVGSSGAAATINYEFNASETLTSFQVSMQGEAAAEAAIAAGTTCQFQSYTASPAGSGNPITATNPFTCIAQVQGVPAYPGIRNGAINLLGMSNALLNSVSFTETGSAAAAWIAPGLSSTAVVGLTSPEGLAISGENGNVYIADFGGQVYSWKGLNGTNSPLTEVKTSPVTLYNPIAVALDGAGDLLIADWTLAKVVVVPANTAIQPYYLATGSLLQHPVSLIFDAEGNLYIGDAGPNGDAASSAQPGFVVKVPASGAPISIVSTSPASVVFPRALAADAAGNLYIGDGGDFLTGGDSPPQVVLVPQGGAAPFVLDIPGLAYPSGLAVDPAGQLWVLDYTNPSQITIVPPNGGLLYTVPLLAANLIDPSIMGFTAGARNLLIADIGHGSTNELILVSGTQAQLSYPQTAVGAQSSAQAAAIVSIGNSGLGPANPGGNLYSMGGNTRDFQLQSGSTCLSFTQLLPTQSCSFSAIFSPVEAGIESESITSAFNSAAQVQLLLTGTTTNSSSFTASPTLSPGSGFYATAPVVSLSDTTSGATIYYTVNGATPTTSSTVYHNPSRLPEPTRSPSTPSPLRPDSPPARWRLPPIPLTPT